MLGLRVSFVVLGLLAAAAPPARADVPLTIGAGSHHTCAVLAPDRRVVCWGEGAEGQLGDGTSTASPTPITVSGLIGAVSVSGGEDHTCAALSDGSVDCWGSASPFDSTVGSVVPQRVPGVSGAVAVSAGSQHDCALIAGGSVECWGSGASGELGNGSTADGKSAVAVSGIGSAVAIGAGAGHSCAVLSSGQVACWGRGDKGELGNGAFANSSTPVLVSGITTAVAIGVGTSHACAVLADGSLRCWGADDRGQLGDGGTANRAAPVAVAGIDTATAVGAGGVHTCALLSDGPVECWGYGGDGELGTGTKASSPTPVPVASLGVPAELSTGFDHTCVRAAGGVECWGDGDHGELGDGRGVTSATPVTVAGLDVTEPVFGSSITLQRVSGTVRIKPPGSARFVALGAVSSVPLGTSVDATAGKLRLTSAADTAGRTQAGLFYSGEFATAQQPQAGGAGLTTLTLTAVARSACASAATAASKPRKKKKTSNSLWGDAKGNFQTAGRYASATVRGTKWLVEDTCEGTSVTVATGAVRVENLVTHKTSLLAAGHSTVVRSSGRGGGARGFVASVEALLTRLSGGRRQLSTALSGALRCSVSPRAAWQRLGDVIDNRTSIRSAVAALAATSRSTRTARTRLEEAIDHSLAADRHYRDWLSALDARHASCPLPHTAAFTAAGAEDAKATTAKRRFVAAFNPLARSEHMKTWSATKL
jgi:alpha-tubulin suppressor-like RCC1 family protein